MKRFALLIAAMAFVSVVPAEAKAPAHPASTGNAHSCNARNKGYNASGQLTSATLNAATKKGHYDGPITVDVTRANHGAMTGTQMFTLSNARVRFGKGVSSTAPAAGSRVRLHGKITVLPHGCSTTGFTPTITIHKVDIQQAT